MHYPASNRSHRALFNYRRLSVLTDAEFNRKAAVLLTLFDQRQHLIAILFKYSAGAAATASLASCLWLGSPHRFTELVFKTGILRRHGMRS
jgi:hypothetical protein